MTSQYRFFATAPKFTENLLLQELSKLGITDIRETLGGVSFSGELTAAYQACLWSRIANRVLVNLHHAKVETPDDLYNAIFDVPWSEHFSVHDSFLINFFSSDSVIQHSQFGAQKCKDAIVDQFRQVSGERPNVNKDSPDIVINVHLKNKKAAISLDLSGHSLHQRGYRQHTVTAPLKENLAAAVLMRSRWPELASKKAPLIDPMCGSGTLLIEAAGIALNIAPGLYRTDFGFNAWKKHQADIWDELRHQAELARNHDESSIPRIIGFDRDAKAISAAGNNVQLAGLENFIELQQRGLDDLSNDNFGSTGLIISNAPYGKRLSDNQSLIPVYETLGKQLKRHFAGWTASILTSDASLAKATGLHTDHINKIYNANLMCHIYHFQIYYERPNKYKKPISDKTEHSITQKSATDTALSNRLRKNIKHLRKWADRNNVSCYRVYDADLPEYNFAIDLYKSDKQYIVLQEYAAPGFIDEHKVITRRKIATSTVKQFFNLEEEQVIYKQRQRQSGTSQYSKLESTKKFHIVDEANCHFYVNFKDYLDTGLFLDHRITRELIQRKAENKSFLNLFCYTGTASVHAAIGKARSTTSVDMSATYIDWCKKNFELNEIPLKKHQLIQADCRQWLKQQTTKFDLIFLDPPTFSNSKRMDGHFDVQQHYVELINDCASLLSAKGEIIFSTNFKKFEFDKSNFPELSTKEITSQTIPEDFQRNKKIHQCWQLSLR